jgi:uncharacterized protein YebE (UPF0316 family)
MTVMVMEMLILSHYIAGLTLSMENLNTINTAAVYE